MENLITIEKSEYDSLVMQANAYKKLVGNFFDNFTDNTVNAVIADFKKTDLYSEGFLKDFEEGLSKSSYIKRNQVGNN